MSKKALRLCVVLTLVAVVSVGLGQVLAKKPGGGVPTCPQSAPGCACPTYYAPVACLHDGMHCIYSNSCFAACAGLTDCEPIGPGPVIF